MNQKITYLNFNPKLTDQKKINDLFSSLSSFVPYETALSGRFLETHQGAVVFEISLESPTGNAQRFVESANSLSEGVNKAVERIKSGVVKCGYSS